MSPDAFPVFVGYDGREELAWQVCRHSLMSRAGGEVSVLPVRHRSLRLRGVFDRPWHVRPEDGQYVDQRDHRPFSTEFAHTRFLTPHLARMNGRRDGWALFVDCDFLFLGDVARLVAALDPGCAVAVVKRDWERVPEGTKMDGVRQERYPRKLWSSLVAFNLSHPANDALTAGAVSERPGHWLHGFGWLEDEDLICGLDPKWNHIPQLDGDVGAGFDGAVHFSLGGPWLGIRSGEVADTMWLQELCRWARAVEHRRGMWEHTVAALSADAVPVSERGGG